MKKVFGYPVDYAAYVAEFHHKFSIPIVFPPKMPPKARRVLRRRLIIEEAEEVRDAIADGTMAEISKELADLLYVTFGACLEFGVPMGMVFHEVHLSNMKKVKDFRDDGKLLKPEGFEEPDIQEVLDRFKTKKAPPAPKVGRKRRQEWR